MAVDKSDWVAGKILANQAAQRGEAPFMQFEDGRMHTYGEAHRLSNQAGNGFAAAGVDFGESLQVKTPWQGGDGKASNDPHRTKKAAK